MGAESPAPTAPLFNKVQYTMKKILSFFALTALCMGFVACEDGVEDSSASAVVIPQDAPFAKGDLTVGQFPTAAIDLEALNASAQPVVLTSVAAVNVPKGYEVDLVLEMSKTEDFAEVVSADTHTVDGNAQISADELNGVFAPNFTRDPRGCTVFARFAPYIVNGASKVRVGDPDYFVGAGKLTIKPFKPEYVIEDEYYLIGTASNGQVTGGIKLEHSEKSPYDDPKFFIVVDITDDQAANGFQWALAPASTVAAGSGLVLGCEEADFSDAKGKLVEATTAEFNFGAVYESGPYSFSFNLKDLTFESNLAIPMLYTPGASNGWSQGASQVLTTNDYVTYMGYAHLNGEFKMSTKPDWTGKNLGAGDEVGVLSDDPGAGNLKADKDGLYWLVVNYNEMTYTMSFIDTLGIIGGFNDWSAQVNLNPNSNFLIWTGTVSLKAGQEFKFRANDNWDINLGGAQDDLKYNDPNIVTDKLQGWDGDGEYTLTLDLSAVPYSFTIVKK